MTALLPHSELVVHILKMWVCRVQQVLAHREPSDSKEALAPQDVWRSATTMSGAQCVMTRGTIQMPGWLADSWGYQAHVRILLKSKIKLIVDTLFQKVFFY